MYETRIAADLPTVAAVPGLAPAIDALADCNLGGHGFLRAAWFGAEQTGDARTLVLSDRRGTPLAAIPAIPFGPAIAGARKVPGAYWPFRSVPLAPGCTVGALAHGLAHPAAAQLGPVWRLGPARADDPATLRLVTAAQLAGWTVLSRPSGTSWVIDLHAARRAGGWPRPSTAKRLDRLERRLAAAGQVAWRTVRGSAWSDAVLDDLAAVEAASWIAADTDGSGAKFLRPQQRATWRSALADPVLADKLCATLLTVDDSAVAFSFDLDDGPVRYGIAGSYRADFARYEVGKIANHRAAADAFAAGQSVVDLGSGDSGYKRAMGAEAGYKLADLLFVKNRTAARLMARVWGAPVEDTASV